MANWNRLIVGDAFKLPSRNPRFYVDLILMIPTLLAGLLFFSCFHGWHIYSWDLQQAYLSGALLCVFLLLIKERTIVIAGILGFLGYQSRITGVLHGDIKVLGVSLLFYGGAALLILFRIFVLKKPDVDPSYRKPDRENTWLGVLLVLGILFGIGFVGIYLAWR